jgi:hypothetical protein
MVAASLLGVGARALLGQGADRYPHVVSIEIGARRVRVYWTDCMGEGCYTLSAAQVWELDRTSGAWTRTRDRPMPRFRQVLNDSTAALVDGMRLESSHAPGSVPQYVVDSAHGRAVWPLVADLSRAERWRVMRQDPAALLWFYSDVPTFNQDITAFAVSPDAFWFGGFGQHASPAAILRFDRASHATTALAAGPMAQTYALGLAVTHRALFFIGDTRLQWLHPKGIGLARYDFASGTWHRFTAAMSPLPDDDATAIAASGDSLFVATHDGIGIYDDATAKWTVRYFAVRAEVTSRREVIPGSGYTDGDGVRRYEHADREEIIPRWTLATRRTDDNPRELAIVAAAAELSPQDSASEFVQEGITMAPTRFIATMRGVPVAHYDSAFGQHGFDVERALADNRLVALAGATIRFDSARAELNDGVVGAIGRVRARQYLESLRSVVKLDSSRWSPRVAYALAALGDSAGLAHLRAYAAEPLEPNGPSMTVQGFRYPSLEAAERLVMLGDAEIVTLLANEVRKRPGAAVYALLHDAATPEVWRAALRDAVSDPAAVSEALRALAGLSKQQLAPDGETREAVLRVARRAFELPPRFDSVTAYPPGVAPAFARQIILTLGDTGAISSLIGAAGVEHLYIDATVTLIELSGVDALPVPPNPTAAQRVAGQRFWRDWWASRQSGFAPARADAGVEALRRYRDRWIGRGRGNDRQDHFPATVTRSNRTRRIRALVTSNPLTWPFFRANSIVYPPARKPSRHTGRATIGLDVPVRSAIVESVATLTT